MKLDHVHCHDEADGWGDTEPYLWTLFFKIDGDSVPLTGDLKLSGTTTVVTTTGSHGNLGTSDVNAGGDVPIPSPIGEWSPRATRGRKRPGRRRTEPDDAPNRDHGERRWTA
jgi:hypothetical protein